METATEASTSLARRLSSIVESLFFDGKRSENATASADRRAGLVPLLITRIGNHDIEDNSIIHLVEKSQGKGENQGDGSMVYV